EEQANQVIADYTAQLNEDVQPINNPPQISGVPDSYGAEGNIYSFTPTASDPDNDNLNFQISYRPSWASFNTTTGTLSGTPSFVDAGSYTNIVISVSDGQATASLAPFSITVSDTNRAPSISGTPASTVVETNSYSFTPTASDLDGDRLTFDVSGLPTWASFDPINGTLAGRPDYQDAGSYDNITIRVSDGQTSASLPPFSIIVDNLNRPPTLTGESDTSVAVGDNYSFTPYASDPDGDELLFSISNPPPWVEFDSSTGTLSGNPETTDVGIYEDIILAVSDGSDSTVTMTITITVDELTETTGTAALSWQIPTTRTDGTPLTISEIEGYRVYMGDADDNLVMIVDLNDGTQTSYTVTDLTAGNYHFAVTTYDTDGNESLYSNIAVKEIL
ncbi:MAG: putative Ig domain-containing protein, partial [Chromatiales bacterium]